MTILLPAIESFKKESKTYLKKLQAKDPSSSKEALDIYPDQSLFTLMHAQHIIALKHGFKSWLTLEQASPIEQRLALTMKKNPLLTCDGWGISNLRDLHKMPHAERIFTSKKSFEREREDLRRNFKAVELTYYWIKQNMIPIKNINKNNSSYNLKHKAEHDIGYITNGIFIAAALIAGYQVKDTSESINVYFNMSKKAITEVHQRQYQSRNKTSGTLMH